MDVGDLSTMVSVYESPYGPYRILVTIKHIERSRNNIGLNVVGHPQLKYYIDAHQVYSWCTLG